MARELKGCVKEVLGTANSIGCTIDGSSAMYDCIVICSFIIIRFIGFSPQFSKCPTPMDGSSPTDIQEEIDDGEREVPDE
eukprot:gene8813-biopygen19329